MKTLVSISKSAAPIAALLLLANLHLTAESLNENALLGLWQTKLSENGSNIILVFEFKATESDSLECMLSFPESGMNNMPFGKYVIKDDSLHLPNFTVYVDNDGKGVHCLFNAASPPKEMEFIKIHNQPVFEFNIPDKKPSWQFPTKDAIWSPPTIHKDHLIVGNDAGKVFLIRLDNQNLEWTFKCEGKVRSKALVADSDIYFTSDDGFLYDIDLVTGSLNWKVDIGNALSPRSEPAKEGSSDDYLCSSPTLDDGIIYVGSKDSCLYALGSEKGEILWKYKTGNIIRSTPLIDDGIVYVGSWDHFMYAIDAKTSELIWKFDAYWNIQSSPVIYENNLIFGSRGTFVFAVDKKTGKEVWKTPYWTSWVESSPVIYDGIVYIGSSDLRKVNAVDPQNGEVLSCTLVEGWAWPTAAVNEKHIFTGTIGSMHSFEGLQGRFYALDRTTGKPEWSFKVDDDPDRFAVGFASSPVIWKDQVFVGGLDGTLYGFAIEIQDLVH